MWEEHHITTHRHEGHHLWTLDLTWCHPKSQVEFVEDESTKLRVLSHELTPSWRHLDTSECKTKSWYESAVFGEHIKPEESSICFSFTKNIQLDCKLSLCPPGQTTCCHFSNWVVSLSPPQGSPPLMGCQRILPSNVPGRHHDQMLALSRTSFNAKKQ